jgi:signal transduction histidine kinase
MSLILNRISALLSIPPGNLLYHILLVFLTAGVLLGSIRLYRSSQYPQVRRVMIGLGILLGLQSILFLASWMVLLGWFDPRTVLPPLDRAVTLLTVIWVAWIWAFPEPLRIADYSTGILSILTLILSGVTLTMWAKDSSVNFNGSTWDIVWQVCSLAVTIPGILLLCLRKPNGWSNGLAMLLLAFLGHLVSLFRPMVGDFPGFLRLTQVAMFPILLMILQRFPTMEKKGIPGAGEEGSSDEPTLEQERTHVDPKTLQALLSLAAEVNTEQIGRALTRSLAQALQADLCFLLILSKERSLSIACGYDLVRDENLNGMDIDRDSIPMLATAIQRGRSLRLPASSTSPDHKGLEQILNIPNPGHLLSVPITSPDLGSLGSILLLSPYSDHLWTAKEQDFLVEVSDLFLPILERGQKASALERERDQALQGARRAEEQAAEAVVKTDDATRKLDEVQAKLSQSQLRAENLAAMLGNKEEPLQTIASPESQIGEVQQPESAGKMPRDNNQLELELRQTLEELAYMKNEQANANLKLLESKKDSIGTITHEQMEIIASISQEIRQPMSSITGYADLLLGESVGILGALQRKFIERIKASTERIDNLTSNLIQMTSAEPGIMEFNAESIDLNNIIDNAMSGTSSQIREKNITLRLDIPNSIHVQTDREALQQIFTNLLQNAAAATHAEGTITLRVQMQNEENERFLAIQVTDTGGGIAAGDIRRVFSRRYRAEHSLIPGLGDTGVGLSITKSLAEAQGGRIWVETDPGIGSTFSILLPVALEMEEEK